MTTSSTESNNGLIAPHGGELIDLIRRGSRAAELERESAQLPKWVLSERQLCDIEQLITGAFSPLRGFMNRSDYQSVCDEMRLSDGTLWPIPIVMDLPRDETANLSAGNRLALRHPEGDLIAVLTVGDIWEPDRAKEASKVFGSTDTSHPGIDALINRTNPIYVGGELEAVRPSVHHTYRGLRHTPAQLREKFVQNGWSRVVAFQTRNPMHRAHVELTRRAAIKADANLLIHPVVGLTKPGDVEYHTRVRCYRAVIGGYPNGSATLSLLQLAMRMGGPREAIWHAIVRKNYGCSHFIVGRDHAGPGNDSRGEPFYGPYDAQDLVAEYRDELKIEVVAFQEVVYDGNSDGYLTREELSENAEILNISGTELRDRLQKGAEIPEWFSFPDVITELRKSYPQLEERGFNVLITGTADSNEAETLADILEEVLLENGTRPVTNLNGSIDIATAALVAREASKNGGAVLIASHAPSTAKRYRAELNGVLIHADLTDYVSDDNDEPDLALSGISLSVAADAVIARLTQIGVLT